MLLGLSLAPTFEADASSATHEMQITRSAGKLKHDQNADLKQLLRQSETFIRVAPQQSENYAATTETRLFAGVANRHDQIFEIFDADLQPFADLDNDGYYHALNVFFDVDVSYGDATIYAKLYLSRDGGDWYHHYTTDLFEIDGDAAADTYEVETELLSGYPPGYYDLLIEIYSLDHAYLVASRVLDYSYLETIVRLEDLTYDDPYYTETYYETEYVEYSHGASSVGGLLLLLLMVQVVIAARGFLRIDPP